LDKTISHSRLGTGDVRRLTVAVVVDNQRVAQPDGSFATQPYSDEDLTRFSNLVKEAVGYDAARGDRVTVTNAAFRIEEALPAAQLWEQAWFWPLLKQLGAGFVIIILIFGVLRPAVKGLIRYDDRQRAAAHEVAQQSLPQTASGERSTEQLPFSGPEEILMLEAPQSYEKRLEFAQQAIDKDPKRVAQLIKAWMGSNG
jgi:flagellar M-ring protein FliF